MQLIIQASRGLCQFHLKRLLVDSFLLCHVKAGCLPVVRESKQTFVIHQRTVSRQGDFVTKAAAGGKTFWQRMLCFRVQWRLGQVPVSQWPCVLKRRSAAARLLKMWVRIPPRGGHGCLSVVSVVCCCQVEVCATSWSLVQRSHTDCGCVVVCDLEISRMRNHTQSVVIELKLLAPELFS